MNNAQTQVLEHIDRGPDAAGAADGPAPTLTWTPPHMQPLTDDPDLQRQTHIRGEAQVHTRGGMSEAHMRVQTHMRNMHSEAQARSVSQRGFDVDPLMGQGPAHRQPTRLFGVVNPTPLVVTSVPL